MLPAITCTPVQLRTTERGEQKGFMFSTLPSSKRIGKRRHEANETTKAPHSHPIATQTSRSLRSNTTNIQKKSHIPTVLSPPITATALTQSPSKLPEAPQLSSQYPHSPPLNRRPFPSTLHIPPRICLSYTKRLWWCSGYRIPKVFVHVAVGCAQGWQRYTEVRRFESCPRCSSSSLWVLIHSQRRVCFFFAGGC
jgi:hypothetical protein